MDEISIQELFQIVLKRFWLVSIIFFVAAVGTAVVMYGYMEDEYTASAEVLVLSDQQTELVNYNDVLASEKLVTDYKKIMVGNRIMDAAAKRLNIDEIDLDKVNVTSETGSRIIRIDVTNTSPQEAFNQVSAIEQEFMSAIKTSIMGFDNVRETNYPKVPLEPSGPPRMRNTAIGALVGLLLGIGLAAMLGLMDTTLNTAEDVERALGLPVLAIVPRYKRTREVAAREAERSTVKL